MDAFAEIQKIIAANLAIPLTSVRPGSRASDLPQWDSLQHVLIVMDIEESFRFKFALEEIADLDSVEKIMAAVQRRVLA